LVRRFFVACFVDDEKHDEKGDRDDPTPPLRALWSAAELKFGWPMQDGRFSLSAWIRSCRRTMVRAGEIGRG
jgi:hypothetical protein